MNRDRMAELLQSLPRDGASEFFTTRVMAAIRAPRRRAPSPVLRWGTAAATLTFATVVGFVAADWRGDRAQEARLAAARTEQQHLEAELEALKQLATTDSTSMLYVGSAGHYDYFIDLRALEERSAGNGRNVQLANYQPGI